MGLWCSGKTPRRRGLERSVEVNEADGEGGVTAQAEEEAWVKVEPQGQLGGNHMAACCSWFLQHEAGADRARDVVATKGPEGGDDMPCAK